MAKLRGVEAKLHRLRTLRHEAVVPEHVTELRQFLADKSSIVVAEAAEIVGVRQISELAPDLVAAFHRFMIEPAESDKGCRAKIAIIEALNKIEYQDDQVYLFGIRHVQPEPRWGGSDDTAAPLRANAAFGLVRLNHRDVLSLLADLLADPEKAARSGATQALGASGARAAIPLLRFKARLGDADALVTGECFTALLALAPDDSLSFVASFLATPDIAVREGAALALGETRRADAFEILKNYWPKVRRDPLREVVLLAISMTRLPAAIDFLVENLTNAEPGAAQAVLAALAIHRHNEAITERIAAVVAQKGDASLQERFNKAFRGKP